MSDSADEHWVPIAYNQGDPQPRISDGVYRGIRSDGKGGYEGLPRAIPTAEEESAAALLRERGWVLTPPAEVNYGCFCDLASCHVGTEPDGCVIDENRPQDCIYSSVGRKEKCQYWQPWTKETLAAFWKKYGE